LVKVDLTVEEIDKVPEQKTEEDEEIDKMREKYKNVGDDIPEHIECAKCGRDISNEGAVEKGGIWWCPDCYEIDLEAFS